MMLRDLLSHRSQNLTLSFIKASHLGLSEHQLRTKKIKARYSGNLFLTKN